MWILGNYTCCSSYVPLRRFKEWPKPLQFNSTEIAEDQQGLMVLALNSKTVDGHLFCLVQI